MLRPDQSNAAILAQACAGWKEWRKDTEGGGGGGFGGGREDDRERETRKMGAIMGAVSMKQRQFKVLSLSDPIRIRSDSDKWNHAGKFLLRG